MKRILLEKFIKKYSVADAIKAVNIDSTGSSIDVIAISENQNIAVKASLETDAFEKGTYPINDSKSFLSLISVLGPEFSVGIKKHAGKNMALQFKDESILVTVVLADKGVIEKGPEFILPEFENVIEIDPIFIEKFINAKSALPESEEFTFMSDGSTAEIVVGYSTVNTNRISIKLNSIKAERIESMNFPVKYMRDLLYVNKEASSGRIEISSEGMARVSFKIDEFNIEYFLFKSNSDN